MRQFLLNSEPDKNGVAVLSGKDYKYLRQVLRVRMGDMLSVRLPDGSLKNSTVAFVDEASRTITIQFCADGSDSGKTVTRGVQASELALEASSAGGVEYTLFQFIPKPAKLEQIVRQATECGVKYIVPVIGEYSEKSSVISLQGNKKERLERIIKEARQQSGSAVDTTVLSPVTLAQAVEWWQKACETGGVENASRGGETSGKENASRGGETSGKENASRGGAVGFVLSERNCEEKSIRDILLEKNPDKICIAVGSEGGISPEEMEFLEKSLFYGIHFSVNILRCETAALYGIAAVQTAV